jgi:ATP-dependent DNA helicase RecG
LFERVDLVEKIGSGISRIRDAMKVAGLPKPEFKTEGIFTVVFKRVIVEKIIKNIIEKTTREKIIDSIRENPAITTNGIAAYAGITVKGVEYQLSKMQKDKILIREGSKKSGIWKLYNSTRNKS